MHRRRSPWQGVPSTTLLVLATALLRVAQAALCTTYTPTGGGGTPDGCFFQLRSRCAESVQPHAAVMSKASCC